MPGGDASRLAPGIAGRTYRQRKGSIMGNDLGKKLAQRLLEMDFDTYAPMFMPDGSARQRQWSCEDGYIVVYTTERVDRGKWAGKFVTMLYTPKGKGARTGNASRWERTYARAFSS